MPEATRDHPTLRRALVLAIGVLGLLGVPQLGATGVELLRAGGALLTQGPRLAAALRTPGAGEEALGPMRDAVELLRIHGVERYRASPGIAADALSVQRLSEGAWPIRPAGDADVVVSFLDEPNPCAVVAERRLQGFPRGGVRVARCP